MYPVDDQSVIETEIVALTLQGVSPIIIVSDHGEKGYLNKNLWNYQIPFIVIREDIQHEKINDLYSDLDFKDILFSYITNKSVEEAEISFIMGQTLSSEFAFVDKDGNYFLGKISDNTAKIREINGFSENETKDLIKKLMKYKQDSEIKSTEEHYYCELCESNEEKANS